ISRMSGSKPRKRGSTWDEDSLRRAMETVQNNQLNTNAAALKFNIPRRTLRNHLLSGNSTKIIGKTTVLTKQLEEDLSQRIKRFEKLGIPLTPKFIQKQAFLFCESPSTDASDMELDNTVNDPCGHILRSSMHRFNDADTKHDALPSLYDNPVPSTPGL
ncbi:hypothetical protein HHI36_005587, partial [Cryptolaemus montrouzieri]